MDGAFRIQHVLDPQLVSRVFRSFEMLFDLPEERKRACQRNDFLRGDSKPEFCGGYTPPGVESVRDLPKDQYRSFWDIAPEKFSNHFPEEFDGRDDLDELWDSFLKLAVWKLYGEYPRVAPFAEGGMHSLRVSHYAPRTPGAIDMPSHTDIGLYTAYVGGSEPGLQCKIGGKWHDVINPLGDVIIGAGTALRLYEPSVVPFKHRVVSCGKRRVSIAFFVELRADVLLPSGESAGERLRRIVSRIRGPYAK